MSALTLTSSNEANVGKPAIGSSQTADPLATFMTTAAVQVAATNALCDTLPAIFVWSDDGQFQYFHAQDIEYDDDGDPSVEARWADSPARPGEPVPLLALKRGGEGLWIGDASKLLFEYEDDMTGDDGLVAYTMDGVRQLIELARPGDMLIPLGPCVLQPKI